MLQRTYRRGLSVLFLLLITACASEKDNQAPLPGKRIYALDADVILRSDPDASNIAVELIEPDPNVDWPQQGENAAHMIKHYKASGLNEVLWTQSIGSGNSSTRVLNAHPVAAEGQIYTLDTAGRVKAFDAKTGHVNWEHHFDSSHAASGGGVAYHNGFLYATIASGRIAKINAVTGAITWQKNYPEHIRSAPAIFEHYIVFMTAHNETVVMDTENAEVIWKHRALDYTISLTGGAAPAVTDLVVIAPYPSGEIHALHPQNGYSLWNDTLTSISGHNSTSMIGQIKAMPVIDRHMLYIISHGQNLVAYDLRSGVRVWEKPVGGMQTPVVAESFLFLMTNNNDLVCLTRDTGRVVWVHTLPLYENPKEKKGRIAWGGPVLAGGKVIVAGTNNQALALSPQDGQILETLQLPGPVNTTPIVYDEKIYFLTNRGELVAVQ